ncbi:MAG: twin-arginine translocation signal domain-containing protein [Chloroflexota bacterium]|nr:twin-arginine translocation signal domain-containing protein [Chloroflexota bacterium]
MSGSSYAADAGATPASLIGQFNRRTFLRIALAVGAAGVVGALLDACGSSSSTAAPATSAASAVAASPIAMTQTTASYKIVLGIGPVETMLTPDQAKGATSGEVMAQMPGMAMPTMMMTDQGQPVNHHLEVHITNTATGALIKDQMPMITITDPLGKSRTLDSMAMYGVAEGVSDWHFGNSVYLPNGTYTISVQVGNEQAVFKSLMVTA